MVSLLAIEDALLKAATEKKWELKDEGPSLAIIGKDVPGGKPELILISVFDTDLEEVNQTLRSSGFSNLIRISDVVRLEEIPIMGTGKVNYRILEEAYFNSKKQH